MIDIDLAGATIFEFTLYGAALGVAGRFAFSILQGQLPGDGIIPAVAVGAVMGAMIFIFQSGILN
jgi:hypothetical protein